MSIDTIVLANRLAKITISGTDARVLSVLDLKSGRNVCPYADNTFFKLETRDGAIIPVEGLALSDGILTVRTGIGGFRVGAGVFDDYFTFELLDPLPAGVFRLTIAELRFVCDTGDKESTGCIGIALTANVDPLYYPDSKSGRTGGAVYPHLGTAGAKYALIIAPICLQKDIIKEVCYGIDKRRGICSKKGGAWGRDERINFTNYTIQFDSSEEFLDNNIPFFKSIGVDQIDFHKGPATYRQGDFRFAKYENAAEFKEKVALRLEKDGLTAGLHTYSHYIDYDCDTILSRPENQAQLKTMETFTLAKVLSEADTLIETKESAAGVSDDFGFCVTNTPFLLIDREIIRFKKHERGFEALERGCAGTKAAVHNAGAAVKHLEGQYFGFTPVLGSDLFYEIARNTAKAYNEGGFRSIYLDALDGISAHCDPEHEAWYYSAEFVREMLLYCNDDPVLEMSTFMPSIWAARGRIGAWDTPYRGYKEFNRRHTGANLEFIDRYGAPILGWYDFYPMTDKYPGGEHTKYHFTDAVDHMGSLAVMYDFANVFNGTTREQLGRFAGLRRNIALYKKYDDLRKAGVLTEAQRRILIERNCELAMTGDGGGGAIFKEKSYQRVKFYDIGDQARNKAVFRNPYAAQTPFLRIEALMSSNLRAPITLLELDENKELNGQVLSRVFERETDISDRLAKVVKVHGNGQKGGKICIKLRCATNSEKGFGEYIIDTDFVGDREFILVESDNGERTDHGFEKDEGVYGIFRSSLNNDRITEISIETEGNTSGVRMSSINACEHVYEVLKDPTVTVGTTSLTFECELMSSDYIEFDGKTASVTDRYGNSKQIWFSSGLEVPAGEFEASVSATPLNRCVPRCALTFGFDGPEVLRVPFNGG